VSSIPTSNPTFDASYAVIKVVGRLPNGLLLAARKAFLKVKL
jgi:hypothetical protein